MDLQGPTRKINVLDFLIGKCIRIFVLEYINVLDLNYYIRIIIDALDFFFILRRKKIEFF